MSDYKELNIHRLKAEIAFAIRNGCHYSPQVASLVIHGAIEKIEDLFKKEMEKILEWGCAQGYKKPEGIEYKIEIEGRVYTIPEAVEMFLKTKQ